MNINIQGEFQICIGVPLSKFMMILGLIEAKVCIILDAKFDEDPSVNLLNKGTIGAG